MRRASARRAYRAELRNVGGCHSGTEECHQTDADQGRSGVLRVRRTAGGATRVGVTVLLTAAVLIFAGCATSVPGAPTVDSAQVSMYRSEQSASTSAARRELAVTLCRQAMSSMVVMVRGYNAFIRKLSEVHDYAGVGDLDDRARASLIAGADLIRKRIESSTPVDVAASTNRFLDSTGRLDAAIGKRELSGLNPIAAQWTRDKQAVLNACVGYLPVPPTAGASPVPGPGGSGSAPAPSSSSVPSPTP